MSPETTSQVLFSCDIDCNDDNFCLKSGRDADGLRVDIPTEFILIRNCISRAGGGLITFGSETSGGIRNVLAHDLQAKGTGVGLRFKSAMTRGGTVEDIFLRDIQMDTVGVAIEIGLNWNPAYSYSELPEGFDEDSIPSHWKTMLERVEPEERGIPTFRNIEISKAMTISGAEVSPIKNILVKDSEINSLTAGSISHSENVRFERTSINTEDNEPVKVSNSKNVEY